MKFRTVLIGTLIVGSIFSVVLYTRATQSSKREKRISQTAAMDKETSSSIKQLMERMKEQLEIDLDSFPALIQEVELALKKSSDPATTAVLHSLLAEMYNHYYQQNRWQIGMRTEMVGYIPEDIKEWTSAIYTNKITEEIHQSLQPIELLQQTPALTFKEIIEEGKDSQRLYPSLFDFLANRAIEIQPSEELYQQLLSFRRSQPDKKALMLVELRSLQYVAEKDYSIKNQGAYEQQIDSLQSVYAEKDYSVEIIAEKLRILQNKSYQQATPDSIQALQYTICKETIRRFPRYERIGLISNWLKAMEEPRIAVVTNNTVYPGDSLKISIKSTNVEQVLVGLYESAKTIKETLSRHSNLDDENKKLGKQIKEGFFSFQLKNTYAEQDTTFFIPVEAYGLYACVITVPGTAIKTTNQFSVTRLAALSRHTKAGLAEILVTDYKTGKPFADASVNYYGGKRNNPAFLGSVSTDKDGIALLPEREDVYAYQASRQADNYSTLTPLYASRRVVDEQENRLKVSLFTDRGLYRPGQTVFLKGIATINDKEKAQVVSDKTFKVILRDANYKEITTKEFKSNKYGSFSGEFTLPKNLLNGLFTLSTDQSMAYVQVEEYKRPSFSLKIQPIKGEVSFGEAMHIMGEARTFSGVPLAQGEITYRIIRSPFFYRSYNGAREEQVAEGKVGLIQGEFVIPFSPEKDEKGYAAASYQRYEVRTLLTDSKGETQEGRMTFSVGDRSFMLSSNLTEKTDKDDQAFSIFAYSLNGDVIQTKGTYTVSVLEDDAKSKDRYKVGKQALQGTFHTGKPTDKGVFAKLPSGRYRLLLQAKDSKGRSVEESQDLVLYSKDDKCPPVFMHTWMIAKTNSCLPGEEFEVVFGTSDKNAYVLYELFSNGICLSRQSIQLNNENSTFKIPFLESYKEAVSVSFTFVKEGELYTENVAVVRKMPDKNLTIKTETFRNHLLPGDNEYWRLKVLDADSLPVSAEVLASMYDASLDEILNFDWSFSPVSIPLTFNTLFLKSALFATAISYGTGSVSYSTVPQYHFNKLNWQGVMSYSSYGGRFTRTPSGAGDIRMKSITETADQEAVIAENEMALDMATLPPTPEMSVEEKGAIATPVRTNFNETAFFYPFLQTDKDGCLSINFKVPESNTTWKLQMLAHTPDLKYGLHTEKVITSKPLMVLPNLPRFMRKGDKVRISSQIINRQQKEIGGTARLEFFNPETDEPIVCLTKSQKPFTLQSDSVTTVTWDITVPQKEGVIGCRIMADSNAGSDGEQHLIPILSDELLVTEATPFYMNKQNAIQIPMPGASSATSRLHNISFEVSGNPLWYAVQALPTLDLPDNDNVVSWFASYYSNTLVRSMVETHPRLQNVIRRWAEEGGTASTLLSNLEKNEELKNVLLQETPWVMEAKNESQQKQRLVLLFDVNRAEHQRALALQTLLKKQDASGGWGWFDGFYPSRSMTLYILKGMNQLGEMNAVGYEQPEKEMQLKALGYLDKSIQKEYEQLQKNRGDTKDYIPSSEQIDYLFVRSGYREIPAQKEVRDANRYYTAQAEKNWSKLSLNNKGKMALVMQRNGTKAVAKEILSWLRKTATVSAEQGMFWANNRRGSDSFTSPIETHAFLMSVFKTLGAETNEIDLMKQWLLGNKRTQQWESVPATVDAIYAILSTGSDWLSESNAYTVAWGNKRWASDKDPTSALGYIKQVMKTEEQPSDKSSLTITKEGNSPLWGAVYHQYFESISAIKQQKGALSIDKKLFIETNSGTQRQIVPLTAERTLSVGDKVVVRLTIRADRTFDYVNIKDLRAGCFEPVEQVSGAAYRDGLVYYRSAKDVSENFFMAHLPIGTYVLEYSAYVSRMGSYSGGIATIQCMYAPEFVSHTAGSEWQVKD